MRRLFLVMVLAAPTLGGSAIAQAPAVAPADAAAGELATLNATMRQIADLLAKQVEQSGLDLLLKRTQMAVAELQRTDGELQRARGELATLDEQISRLQDHRGPLDVEMADSPPARKDAVVREIESELERMGRRRMALDGEIAVLENLRADRQSEVDGWKAVFDRRLSGR